MTLRVVPQGEGTRHRHAREMAGQTTARVLASPQVRRRCRAQAIRQFDVRAFRTDLPTDALPPTASPTPAARADSRSAVERLLELVPGLEIVDPPTPDGPSVALPADPPDLITPTPAAAPAAPGAAGTQATKREPLTAVERALKHVPGLEL
jgi:hypothetical protein